MQQVTSFLRSPTLGAFRDRLRTLGGNLLTHTGLRKPVVLALDQLGVGADIPCGDRALDAKRFMQRSPGALKQACRQASGSRVLLFGPYGLSGPLPIGMGILALALRLRGADARMLLCDEVLPACELTHATQFADWQAFLKCSKLPRCGHCFGDANRIFCSFELPTMHLSGYLSQVKPYTDIRSVDALSLSEVCSFQYHGIDLGEQVRTSLHRFFLAGTLPDDETTRAVARRYLASGKALTKALERVFQEFCPEVLVAYHGIYLLGGVACEVARKYGVRVTAWDFAYRRHSIVISHRQTYHHELRQEPWDAWENLELSPAQNERLDTYLALRRSGRLVQDGVSYNKGAVTDRERIAKELQLDLGRRQVMLFTNVAWDGRVKVDSNVYEGPTEWVVDTLRHLADRQDVQVVVRIHPAEVKETAWKGLQRVDEEIHKAFPVLPQNVILIPPESKVSSYALAEMADVALVYSTLMGLEVLLMGKPVVITGDAYYSNKGFGIQPASREEYLSVLDDLVEIGPVAQQTLERVRRYAYHFFFRRWLQLPLLDYGGPGVPVGKSLADLLPGKVNGLDRACEGILHGTPFHIGAP